MKKTVFLSTFLAAAFIAATSLFAGGSPVGMWKTIDDETGEAKSHVRVWEKDGKIYGTIVKLLQEEDGGKNVLCTECSGDRKDKPVVGMTFVWGLEKDGDEYTGGQILDPGNGKTYRCKLWREGDTLQVRGSIGPFGRTQTWHLIKN